MLVNCHKVSNLASVDKARTAAGQGPDRLDVKGRKGFLISSIPICTAAI